MTLVAWQGWQLEIPGRWNPVKLEGDYNAGYALFADLHRPRLGLRWKRLGKRTEPVDWAQLALREEVGRLAASEAQSLDAGTVWRSPMLYVEPDPPGRDVWVGVSALSGRAVQVIHHAYRRERILAEIVLPTLTDLPVEAPMPWSVFELSCVVPAGFRLRTQRLLAGDLSLVFGRERQQVMVRQVAVAQLALQRLPLEKWLNQQLSARRKQYRAMAAPGPVELMVNDRSVRGLSRWARRRRRFFYKRLLAPRLVVYALHDEQRDRLVFVESTDEALAREVAGTVGFAAEATSAQDED